MVHFVNHTEAYWYSQDVYNVTEILDTVVRYMMCTTPMSSLRSFIVTLPKYTARMSSLIHVKKINDVQCNIRTRDLMLASIGMQRANPCSQLLL